MKALTRLGHTKTEIGTKYVFSMYLYATAMYKHLPYTSLVALDSISIYM